jgi:hypothetical protein
MIEAGRKLKENRFSQRKTRKNESDSLGILKVPLYIIHAFSS